MKQKDITLIAVVVFVSGVMSLVISTVFISSPKNRHTKVEVVPAITSEFKQPDTRYFNAQAVDPTQSIRIGDNPNTQPFSGQN